MKIFAFIEQYCSDIVAEAKKTKTLIDLSGFPHDETITDEDGTQVQVIYVDGVAVPIMDIFHMELDDFIKAYPQKNMQEAYVNYMDNITFLEGPEAIMRTRLAIDNAINKMQSDAETYNLLGDLI